MDAQLLPTRDQVVYLPFLLKGCLCWPPLLDQATIEAAFARLPSDQHYLQLPEAQVVREQLIDRTTMQWQTQYRYLVLPIVDSLSLIETNAAQLEALAAVSSADLLAFLAQVSTTLQQQSALLHQIRTLVGQTATLPDAFLDVLFQALLIGLDPQAAAAMIDRELALWGIVGRRFLDEWVAVPGAPLPEIVTLLDSQPHGSAAAPTCLRALPTRQLHITAGNAPTVPIVSALRLLLSKSAGVIKLPAGALLSGALFAMAVQRAAPEHPLTRNLSVVYWRGGDEGIETALFAPGAFDRVVVWGAPGAVQAVQTRALFTRVVSFNPRYGASLIANAAFASADTLETAATLAARDSLIYNQEACNAAHVHYIEGDESQARRYAAAVQSALAHWDATAPQAVPASIHGQLRRLRRGRFANAEWWINQRDGVYSSGVLLAFDEFDMLDHPLARLVVVRPVASLAEAVARLHPGVSTVGVYPEETRQALRTAIGVRGVSNILPLGGCERFYAGMPHDGMIVLSELVNWVNG
jgi:hypothetical protein